MVRALTRWLPCDGRVCGGHRLHEIVITTHADGKVTREAVCTVCCEAEPFGICCPRCGDHRLRCAYTRYRAGPVAAVRVKKCRHCGHRVRTKEVIESASAPTRARPPQV